MGKWMNSNNSSEVTDQTFATQICKFDGKNEIPYWNLWAMLSALQHVSGRDMVQKLVG